MNRRKLVIAKGLMVLALLAALVLAGCGGSQPKGNDAGAAKQARASAEQKGSSSERGSDEQGKSMMGEPKPSEQGREQSSMGGTSREMAGPVGDMIEIRKPWAQVRNAPNSDSAAIAVVYGNDTLAVLKQEGDWVQVQFGRNQKGWVNIEATRE